MNDFITILNDAAEFAVNYRHDTYDGTRFHTDMLYIKWSDNLYSWYIFHDGTIAEQWHTTDKHEFREWLEL